MLRFEAEITKGRRRRLYPEKQPQKIEGRILPSLFILPLYNGEASLVTSVAVYVLEYVSRLLAEILSPEGSKDVTVGQPIAITVEDENDVEAVRILSSSNNVVKEEKPNLFKLMVISNKKYDVKVSVNDIVIKVVATASRNVPEANAYWDNGKGELVLCNSVNISAAVATEKGLMTPIIRNPDQKSISSISAEVNMDIG
ncbi:hypothetical protein BC332_29927 [Capsicum chinense]|nr:hypothetical protein BC332_29927 [Capsicum chinense]